jgi:hypothetical protein
VTWPTCEEGYNQRKLTLFASQVVSDFKTIPSLSGGGILEAIARFKGPWWFCNHWLPPGVLEIEDQAGSAALSYYSGWVNFDTGDTADSYLMAMKICGLGCTWDKKRYFRVGVSFPTVTSMVAHLVSGGVGDPTSGGNNQRHIGFKVVGTDLYGTVAGGDEEATILLGSLPSEGADYVLECVLDPTVPECRFYVNGADKGALTTNLPTGTSGAEALLRASIFSTTTYQAYQLMEVEVFQEE